MTPFEERDAQLAALLRREIQALKARKEAAGWAPHSAAWHRAFGEIAGLYRALAFIDPNPHE